eukprot:gnl/TRDRNA2_/TRDRNA2_177104_c1_seq1.p1 gnl/TRDRNA2_/TRDRNA2_177104_c1~~gnl/TRDRNA2_/TRDRNA2_177104_c1_seq1.p1  ORF type:complete len:286 (+),score=-21.39 gnl/TRDRNA2_/TRDRNA2_177104_c1_seq1:77-934(+)
MSSMIKKKERKTSIDFANRFKLLPAKSILTIESTHTLDSRRCSVSTNESDISTHKFKEHLNCLNSPSSLIVTSQHVTKISFKFISEILQALPSATFCERKNYKLTKVVNFAKNKGFGNILVIKQQKNKIDSMLLINMSSDTAALFRISNLKLKAALPEYGSPSDYQPEIMLNNFNTIIGRKIALMLASMFHQEPQFLCRKVVVFNNQRDYIFFRHYRYTFNKKSINSERGKRSPEYTASVSLQDLGPRFTLNLENLYNSISDLKRGKCEFLRHSSDRVNRHTAFL